MGKGAKIGIQSKKDNNIKYLQGANYLSDTLLSIWCILTSLNSSQNHHKIKYLEITF